MYTTDSGFDSRLQDKYAIQAIAVETNLFLDGYNAGVLVVFAISRLIDITSIQTGAYTHSVLLLQSNCLTP
jgi:hypothetical protein